MKSSRTADARRPDGRISDTTTGRPTPANGSGGTQRTVQDLIDGPSQRFELDRFSERGVDANSFRRRQELAVEGARHRDDAQSGTQLVQRVDRFDAVLIGHEQVSEHQVDLRLAADDVHRFLAVGGEQHSMGAAQECGKQFANALFIVHDKNGALESGYGGRRDVGGSGDLANLRRQ